MQQLLKFLGHQMNLINAYRAVYSVTLDNCIFLPSSLVARPISIELTMNRLRLRQRILHYVLIFSLPTNVHFF